MIDVFFDIALIVQVFALLNPLSSFPVLMAAWKQKMDVGQVAINASIVAYAIALAVIFFGPALFNLYGVSLDAFRVAGGIVLLLLGIETARKSKEVTEVAEIDGLVSIIATPLLTGPAVISFLTIKSYELGAVPLLISATGAFAVVGVVFYLFARLIPHVNPKVVDITAKVLGLFLAAIAIEMLAKGSMALLGLKAAAGA